MASLVLTGDTSGQVTVSSPAVAGTNTLTLQAATATNAVNILSTPVASTSGATIDFNSIPAWVKKITVMFAGVSTNGSSNYMVQLGTSGGIQATGYSCGAWGANTTNINSTTGFLAIAYTVAAGTLDGNLTLTCLNTSTGLWTYTTAMSSSLGGYNTFGAGSKTLSGTLDRVRITTVNGTDTFDAGSVNLLLEG